MYEQKRNLLERNLLVAYDGVMYHCFRYELGRCDRHQQRGLSLKWRATAMLYYANLGWTLGFPRGYNL